MARRKPAGKKETALVPRMIAVDEAKLKRARAFLNAPSDDEVVRLAIEHLLSHFEEPADEEQ